MLESGEKKELAPAKLTLNDCLACSGCVTTAETMLIQAQSSVEFFSSLQKREGRTFVVSVSPQVCVFFVFSEECDLLWIPMMNTFIYNFISPLYSFKQLAELSLFISLYYVSV